MAAIWRSGRRGGGGGGDLTKIDFMYVRGLNSYCCRIEKKTF